MTAYGVSFLSQGAVGTFWAPWLGVVAAGLAGMVLGAIHGWLSQQPRVNDVATGHRHDYFR